MEHTTYASRLRYLDADDVDDSVVDYDDLDVRGPDGDKLGDLDGFIVDAKAGRVYYAVVDAGGWFRSKRLLLPIGHVTLDRSGNALKVDVSRDALGRYPQFDENQFREFSDDDLRAFDATTAAACCPGEPDDVGVDTWAYGARRHYTQPAWWTTDAYTHGRLRPIERAGTIAAASTRPVASTDRYETERVTARERAGVGDESPHLEGRAQPGDVLGIETGGELTSIGDTAEDENKRRRDALRDASDTDEEPRRSDR